MFEQIILGTIQGIAEWLPVSSEGIIVLLVKEGSVESLVRQALFLHLGTFLAALIYFRKDVFSLIRTLFNYKKSDLETRKLFNFLILTSLISGFFGFILFKFFAGLLDGSPKIIILVIGFLLLITALVQLKARKKEEKGRGDLSVGDGILLGLVQALAVLPGLSRSGLTVSTLLIRKFKSEQALALSFLMSLPIVLGGNIILNFNQLTFSSGNLLGLFFSFIFGLLTINLLIKLARKINFGYFVLLFGLLIIASVFV